MDSPETAFGAVLPSQGHPISAGNYPILLRIRYQSSPHALCMNFRRFGLDISEQTSRFVLASIHSSQKTAQALLVTDQISIVTSPREFLCLESEIQRFPLPGIFEFDVGHPAVLAKPLFGTWLVWLIFRPIVHRRPVAHPRPTTCAKQLLNLPCEFSRDLRLRPDIAGLCIQGLISRLQKFVHSFDE